MESLIRVRLDLAGGEAEEFLMVKQFLGVKNDTEVVRSLIHRFALEHKDDLQPLLEHFNLNEEGVMILDHTLDPPKGRIIQVLFKPEQVECELCESQQCRHIRFALSLPAVMGLLRKKGWSP
jgi:hypothetical protein